MQSWPRYSVKRGLNGMCNDRGFLGSPLGTDNGSLSSRSKSMVVARSVVEDECSYDIGKNLKYIESVDKS